jgi:hypothetical protein
LAVFNHFTLQGLAPPIGGGYNQRNVVEGEWLVGVKATKVVAKRGIAD